jgi:hypothetical protein
MEYWNVGRTGGQSPPKVGKPQRSEERMEGWDGGSRNSGMMEYWMLVTGYSMLDTESRMLVA